MARYRSGDGRGVAAVTATTSCVQDSAQALWTTVELLRQGLLSGPSPSASHAGGESLGRAIEAVLTGRDSGPHRDALVLGAGLALDLTGRARGLRRGIELARRTLAGGGGTALLDRLRAHTP